MFLPAFKALKAYKPECEIDLINFKTTDEVLMAEPEVCVIRKPWAHFLKCVFHRMKYDHIVVFSGGYEIRVLRYFMRKRSISLLSNTSIHPQESFYHFYRRLIEECFGQLDADDAPPLLTLTESEQQRGGKILDLGNRKQRPIVVLTVGALATWKAYSEWDAVIELMTEHPILRSTRICILGGPPAANIASRLCLRHPQAEDLTNLSLRDAMAVANCVDLVVCADSGFMHVAMALGRPVLALFGATDSTILLHEASLQRTEILSLKLECAPCYQPGRNFVCTNQNLYECMKIPPMDIVQRITEILERNQICTRESI